MKNVIQLALVTFLALALAGCPVNNGPGNNGTKTLTGIAVTTPPTKTDYLRNEAFNPAGMVVTASYSDGTTQAVSGYTTSGFTSATLGSKTVTVSYEGQSGSFQANVRVASVVKIPTGTFMMGSPADEPNRQHNETQHSVTLTKGFKMGKYPVTQGEWEEVMGTNPSYYKGANLPVGLTTGDNLPVEQVSWYDAIEFCNRLSEMEGLSNYYTIDKTNQDPNNTSSSDTIKWTVTCNANAGGYRLPTEAEWEYACRGAYPNKATETNTKPFGIGDGTKMISSMANFYVTYPYDLNHVPKGQYADSGATGYLDATSVVGNYPANNYGLYDMHGNVWEWCWDWYKDDITTDNADPTGAVVGAYRVGRGGGWPNFSKNLRSAFRFNDAPSSQYEYLGFRLACP